MQVFPSSLRGQIILAFSACFIFMAFMIGDHFSLLYFVVLVFLLGFVMLLLGGKILRPLDRLSRESEKITQEVFQGSISSFENPTHEINGLVGTLNRMRNELQHRQELLVQSYKNTAIGSLTAGICHEINNPLNNIVLTLETLIEDHQTLQPEERLELYRETLDQADRAADLVNNLLEFSRANPPRVEEVSIEALIDQTLRLLKNEFKIHRIKVVKEVQGSFPPLFLDKNGLQQVLIHLLLNSFQAMPEGGQVKIMLKQFEKGVRIDIIDTGMGIPDENMNRIFNPFFSTKKGGAGLGLSICRDLLNNQGGRIEVQSQERQGTTFSLTIPLSGVRPDK